MDNGTHIVFNASERSYFAILKREIHQMVTRIGFGEARAGVVDIIVAEISSNLVKHAGGGEVLVRLMTEEGNEGVELISIDNGPGMDTTRSMQDGVSTANTLGQGLGAIKRLSDVFEVYSLKDWGTIVLSRVYKNEQPFYSKKPAAEVRAIVVPKPGEKVSGDGAYYNMDTVQLKLLLGDGLGHGPDAHHAVQEAIKIFAESSETSPAELLRTIHPQVKKTRGLVGTSAVYNFKDKKWRICGVGNIATRVQHTMSVKNSMSYNGVIGMNLPNTLKDQEIAHERGQVIILCSDGIKTRWELQKYVGVFKHDLTILAAVIYKDFARKTDDMSVLAARINTV